MLRILILITCMFLFPDIYGASIFQFCGRYEYNCNYYDGKLYMNLAKIPCHELVITQVDISNNCLDGYLYDFEGGSLHQGDEVMIYTNWQTIETGYAGSHCNGFNLSWVKQIELLKCPHIT